MLNRCLRFRDSKISIVSALVSLGYFIPLFSGEDGRVDKEQEEIENEEGWEREKRTRFLILPTHPLDPPHIFSTPRYQHRSTRTYSHSPSFSPSPSPSPETYYPRNLLGYLCLLLYHQHDAPNHVRRLRRRWRRLLGGFGVGRAPCGFDGRMSGRNRVSCWMSCWGGRGQLVLVWYVCLYCEG